jgi:flavin-dependent dehydrogenase
MQDFGEMFVEHGGYFGVARVGAAITNVAVVVPVQRAPEIAPGRTEFFEQWIAERPHIGDRFQGAERIDDVRATGPFASFSKRAWHPGAALVGDAADFFDPFTGEGIYAALRGGEMLAAHVAPALGRVATLDGALSQYDRARRREFGGKWKIERLIGSAIASPFVFNRVALALQKRRDLADLLVGVAGDFVPAREVLRTRFMFQLLMTAARS